MIRNWVTAILLMVFVATNSANANRMIEIAPISDSISSLEVRVVSEDGKEIIRARRMSVGFTKSGWYDSFPDTLTLHWRIGSGDWKKQRILLQDWIDDRPSIGPRGRLRINAIFDRDRVSPYLIWIPDENDFAVANRDPVADYNLDFTAAPLLSLRFGSPGVVGIQAGLVGGIGSGGGESNSIFGPHGSVEVDFDAPSFRLGLTLVSAGGHMILGGASISLACRLDSWTDGSTGCGPEMDIALLLLHLRVGVYPPSEEARFGFGIGI